jgi:beta-glucosidase
MTFRSYNEPSSVADRKPIDELTILRSNEFFIDYYKPAQALWYGTFSGTYEAEKDGDFEFGLAVYGAGNLYVDDKLVVDNETTQTQGQAFFGSGTVEEKGTVKLEKGKKYNVRVEFASAPACKLISDAVVVAGGGGIRIGGAWVIDAEEEIKNATALAKEVDQVIICAGLNVRPHPFPPPSIQTH